MSLSPELCTAYTAILKEELMSAMGCTEPIAIAYAAAILSDVLGEAPFNVRASFSGNIIKNVKSVIVPATGGLSGIEAAIAAGAISAHPEKKLEVLTVLTPDDHPRIAEYRKNTDFQITELDSPHPFELMMMGYSPLCSATVHIVGHHTNVVRVEKDGRDLTKRYLEERVNFDPTRTDRSLLTVKDIITFAEETPLDELRPILVKLSKNRRGRNTYKLIL